MSVKVEIHPRAVSNAVVVPRGAIAPAIPAAPGAPPASGERRPAKVRMASGELREVTLGACDAQGCAALDGVAAGDAVQVGGPR
jgi:hypothetical protein